MNTEKKTSQKKGKKKSSIKKTKSIGFRLVTVSALLVAVPILFIAIITSIRVSNDMNDDIVLLNEKQATIIEQKLASILDQNVTMMQTLAASPTTAEFIKSNGNFDPVETERLKEELVRLDENMGDGNVTAITRGDGVQLMKTSGDLVDVADREYFQKAMEGSIYVSNINVSKSNGSRICTFAIPVRDMESDSIIGIVQRNYNLADFHDMIKDEIFEEGQEIVMVDRTGSVIAHSAREITADAPEDQSGNPFYTDSRGDQLTGSYSSEFMGDTWMVSWQKEPNTGWVVASCRIKAIALKELTATILMIVVIGVLSLVVAFIIITFFAKRISNPISNVGESIVQLSSGNLTASFNEKDLKNADETGEIGRSAKALAEKLHSVISQTKDMATNLKTSGTELANSASTASDASSQVTEAVDEISRGSVSQAESIQTAAENTSNIGANIDDITNDASQLNQYSKEMRISCDQVTATMEELITQSNDVTASVKEIDTTIRSTNDSANEIAKFSESIQDIASQTNLLSLNASIEAARAGEAGKGFAVVADEIRDLADQSRAAADEIKKVVDVLLANVEASSDVMATLNENLAIQADKLSTTHEDMNQMTDNVKNVATSADNISGRIEGLNSAKAQLLNIIDDLSAISEENAASTEQTNASMQELNATFSIINESASKLQQLADEMDETINFFSI